MLSECIQNRIKTSFGQRTFGPFVSYVNRFRRQIPIFCTWREWRCASSFAHMMRVSLVEKVLSVTQIPARLRMLQPEFPARKPGTICWCTWNLSTKLPKTSFATCTTLLDTRGKSPQMIAYWSMFLHDE